MSFPPAGKILASPQGNRALPPVEDGQLTVATVAGKAEGFAPPARPPGPGHSAKRKEAF